MQAYKEEPVDAYRATIQEEFDREGVELIMGHGTLHGNRIVEVNTDVYKRQVDGSGGSLL